MTARLLLASAFLAAVAVGCGKKPAPEPGPAVANDDDPRPPRPKPRRVEDPNAAFPEADPPPKKKAAAPGWGDGSDAVPLKHDSRVTFGPPGCPVFVVDQDVYDAKTLKVIRKLPEEYDRYARRALAANGRYFAVTERYFAVTEKGHNQQNTETHVFDTNAGTKVMTAPPAGKDAFVDNIRFFGSTHLLLGGRHGAVIDIWDVAAAKKVGGLTAPYNQIREDTVVLSPDGAIFATNAHEKMVVTETMTNKHLATLAGPGPTPGTKATRPGEATFVYAWAKAMAFSPDGNELAMYTEHGGSRLIVWNTKGAIVLDFLVPARPSIADDPAVEWLPDGTGWLVNGHLIDRATRRPLLSVRVPFAAGVSPHLLDGSRVIGKFTSGEDQLQVIPVPWAKLKTALKAASAKTDAFLAPGQPVMLDLQLDGLRGDANETRNVLGTALMKRLARDGIPVAAQAPTLLRLRLSEQAGDNLPIRERQSPFDRQGRDTGRTATAAKGAAVLELWAQGEAAPLWRGKLAATSGTSFSEEINDATLRKSMLDGLGRQLDNLEVPYFIPKGKDTVALPAIID